MNSKIKSICHKEKEKNKMKAMHNFFTSGHELTSDLQSRYQMTNIALILSSAGLCYGIIGNYFRDISGLIPIELFLLFVNGILWYTLRTYKNSFEYVVKIITAQFTFLFLFLVYTNEPNALKHVWLFTYPIVLLYFQKNKNGIYWVVFTILALIIAPLQCFVEVQYSLFQVTYIAFVLIIVTIMVYFFQVKMNEAKDIILEQQARLRGYNVNLEKQLEEKVKNLEELNESLELKVEEKIKELIKTEKLLTTQSKQAVMGEMISMIAHQWRQPLSMITLQISNLQIQKLLGKKVEEEELYRILEEISNTIIYLSETIDDFKTYFHPDRKVEQVKIFKLLTRALNFSQVRLTETHIKAQIEFTHEEIEINTYANEMIQVILNLLNNAIDILAQEKRAEAMIRISVKDRNDTLEISVQDNASGIKKEDLPHIFEPYFSTKGKNGTGLGLYMSQMIIEKQFKGEIKVETSPKGSTFMVTIPKNIS